MSEIILPTIPHADVSLNVRNRVIIQMHEGWVFYDRRDYLDDEGNFRVPEPEEICYSRYGSFSPANDFDAIIVVVAESDVPADQIFGNGNDHEVMSEPNTEETE